MNTKQLPSDHNCGNCFFFHKNGQSNTQIIGFCRANPPTPYFEEDTSNGKNEEGKYPIVPRIGRFPVVLNSMWCGAWDLTDAAMQENNK